MIVLPLNFFRPDIEEDVKNMFENIRKKDPKIC